MNTNAMGEIGDGIGLPVGAIISINPPPSDLRCECCAKHISEINPVRIEADCRAVTDKDGNQYLFDIFRPLWGPLDEEDKLAIEAAFSAYEKEGLSDVEEYLISKYGQEQGKHLSFLAQASSTLESIWHCPECARLSDIEYDDHKWAYLDFISQNDNSGGVNIKKSKVGPIG